MNITHEFRTPLTIILGFSRQMIDGALTTKEQLKKADGMTLRQGDGLLDLINQLLGITKEKSIVNQPLYRHGDTVTYIRMLAEYHQVLAQDENTESLFTAGQSTMMMDSMPSYLVKTVRNLLSNVVKLTPPRGMVRAGVRVEKDKLKLVMRDNGQGIPSNDVSYIFDLFYRSQSPSADVGSGVGLALTKQLVEAIDGTIEVESEVGVGIAFMVILSLKAVHQDAIIKPIGAYKPEKPIFDQIPKESVEEPETTHEDAVSVLVVEDNADVARYIGMQIGHECQLYFAYGDVEGLGRALSLMSDLILIDLLIPRRDGLEMCCETKMSEVLDHIPVIIVTTRSIDTGKLKGLEAGADAYLVKPFSVDELKLRVRDLIRQGEMMQEEYTLLPNVHVNNITTLNRLDKEFLYKFIDYVYIHMNNGTASVESIVTDLCIAPKQLRSKAVATTGEDPSAYIQKIKLEKAQRMLKMEPDISVGEIALKCGFEDFACFSRVFKEKYSVMPSQYHRLPS